MIVAFDTNVLLYASDTRELRKRPVALELLRTADEVIIPWQVACEFIAASRKLAEVGFTPEEAWDQLACYLDAFTLVLPEAGTLSRARQLHTHEGWSFWDAMIVAACLEAGVGRLYTEDRPGSEPPKGLEIINPFA